MKYGCPCGYVYDPVLGDPENGIAPGTAWEDVPADFKCPECGIEKEMFAEESDDSVAKHEEAAEVPADDADKMVKYGCPCGYVYDPVVGDPENGIAPGTAWADVPADFKCPECGIEKEMFAEE